MSAATTISDGMRVAEGMASNRPWNDCGEGISAKVLSVDESRNCVEVLFKIPAGNKSPRHRHTCETHILVVSGRVKNETISCEFGPGDYCYQPHNDEHVEHFVEDTVVYASYRGDSDKLVEFYDDDGKVCGEFKVSDFTNMLNS